MDGNPGIVLESGMHVTACVFEPGTALRDPWLRQGPTNPFLECFWASPGLLPTHCAVALLASEEVRFFRGAARVQRREHRRGSRRGFQLPETPLLPPLCRLCCPGPPEPGPLARDHRTGAGAGAVQPPPLPRRPGRPAPAAARPAGPRRVHTGPRVQALFQAPVTPGALPGPLPQRLK